MMSLRAYAKRRGVSAMSVSTAVKVGRLAASVTRDEFGQPKIADPDLADREWEANTDAGKRAAAAGGVDPREPVEQEGDDESYQRARARKERAVANLKELELAKRSNELVLAASVERRLTGVFTQCKTRLLSIPSRLKQDRPHLTLEDVDAIEARVREALEDLRWLTPVDEEAEGGGDDDTE